MSDLMSQRQYDRANNSHLRPDIEIKNRHSFLVANFSINLILTEKLKITGEKIKSSVTAFRS